MYPTICPLVLGTTGDGGAKLTSSTRNIVPLAPSVVTLKLTRIVCPTYADRLNVCSVYLPVLVYGPDVLPALRFESVVSVCSTVPLVFLICTAIVSKAVVVVVSSVVIFVQNCSVGLLAAAGMVSS